ncbi:hypothetical protein NEHOM01_1690 [Nematocida homosporus]|uniref:uncharacterized protein n=1 Tax=Nematocida homosporus TaxID=1912981 RepID=UPI0022209616|nr:uncharacterized protein NEHOM01_1690 [Nematocida homosporus]KAI5186759.1 hypothetical protein NEHOM01_1690 [Nematocida homosporus]
MKNSKPGRSTEQSPLRPDTQYLKLSMDRLPILESRPAQDVPTIPSFVHGTVFSQLIPSKSRSRSSPQHKSSSSSTEQHVFLSVLSSPNTIPVVETSNQPVLSHYTHPELPRRDILTYNLTKIIVPLIVCVVATVFFWGFYLESVLLLQKYTIEAIMFDALCLCLLMASLGLGVGYYRHYWKKNKANRTPYYVFASQLYLTVSVVSFVSLVFATLLIMWDYATISRRVSRTIHDIALSFQPDLFSSLRPSRHYQAILLTRIIIGITYIGAVISYVVSHLVKKEHPVVGLACSLFFGALWLLSLVLHTILIMTATKVIAYAHWVTFFATYLSTHTGTSFFFLLFILDSYTRAHYQRKYNPSNPTVYSNLKTIVVFSLCAIPICLLAIFLSIFHNTYYYEFGKSNTYEVFRNLTRHTLNQ